MVICKELIISDLTTRGTGTGLQSPLRCITQVYDKSGKLIAEHDPNGGFTLEDLVAYAEFYAGQKGSIQEWLAARR